MAVTGHFDLLRQMFGRVTIAQAVFDEAAVCGRDEGGAKAEVLEADWLDIVPVRDRLAVDVLLDELDLGEAETIVLARQIGADWVLMDEKKGRRKLNELRLNKIGTVGLLLKAKELGLLPHIKSDLALLRERGFSISQPVIEAVLRQVGEQ